MTSSRRTTLLWAVALVLVLTPAALTPIRNYDFFWHLATGRWIVEHRALPLTDPFAVASDRAPWINGEWLFEVLLYACGSIAVVSWLKAIGVGALFAFLFVQSSRHTGRIIALALTLLAFAGAMPTLDARPATMGAALLALALVLLEHHDGRFDVAFVVLTVFWINVHPTALLAPALALLYRRVHWLPIASGLSLLLNPHGIGGVLAPVRLTLFATSGTFVNAEWLPSSPAIFPLLYAGIVLGVAVLAMSRRSLAHAVAFALLAYLAVAHVRNQSLFFVALPMLLSSEIGALAGEGRIRLTPSVEIASCALALLAYGWVLWFFEQRPGVAAHRFPAAAAARLAGSRLEGNVYNPDQFGGFLIWTFYPQRRVLTDGRNELYHTYVDEYASARLDSRAWRALLTKYRIALAIDEYRAPLEVVDPRSRRSQLVPASLAYWPKREWALIGYDDVGMVFARRSAFSAERIAKLEIEGMRPDAARQRPKATTAQGPPRP